MRRTLKLAGYTAAVSTGAKWARQIPLFALILCTFGLMRVVLWIAAHLRRADGIWPNPRTSLTGWLRSWRIWKPL